MPKQVINIDASCLSSAGCVLALKRNVIDGYREKATKANMIYGSGVHKYIDTMYKTGGNIKAAREAAMAVFNKPKIVPKTQQWLADERHFFVTCYNYWEDCISKDTLFETLMLPDGLPATEVNFSYKLLETETVIVNAEGTIDRIGKIKNGCYCIRDFKTTAQYNKEEYLAGYRLSRQLRFYSLFMKWMALNHPTSVLGQIGATRLGCCIDGIFLKGKATDNEYASSDMIMYSDEDLMEFQQCLMQVVNHLVMCVGANEFPREGIVNNTCYGEYNCKYVNVCPHNTTVQNVLLARDFIVTPYEPLKFGEL